MAPKKSADKVHLSPEAMALLKGSGRSPLLGEPQPSKGSYDLEVALPDYFMKVQKVPVEQVELLATQLCELFEAQKINGGTDVTLGRPSKFTPDRVAIIIQVLQDGNHVQTACALAGVSYSQVAQWRNDFQEFSDVIDASIAVGEAQAHSNIRAIASRSGPTSLEANMFLLERGPARKRWQKEDKLNIDMEVSANSVLIPIIEQLPPELGTVILQAIRGQLPQEPGGSGPGPGRSENQG
jgi:transposase-like protein